MSFNDAFVSGTKDDDLDRST